MIRRQWILLVLFAVLAFVFTLNLASNAEARRAQITQKVDDSHLTTLVGNTRPETRSAVYDRGSARPICRWTTCSCC